MRPVRLLIVIIASVGSASALGSQAPARTVGIDTSSIDRSVRPQDDFYRFVNGGWLRKTQIPADASRWSAFDELEEKSREAVHDIVDELTQSKAAVGGERRKVADIYAAFMDSSRIDSLGLVPIQGELNAIAAVASNRQLPAAFARSARLGVKVPFRVVVAPNPKRSTVNLVVVGQWGLGMPDRDYYLLDSQKMADARQAYQSYVTQLLTLANQPDPGGGAAGVVALETALATAQWDRARSRDVNATYNRMSVSQLTSMSHNFSWLEYIAVAGLIQAATIDVRQPDYVTSVDSIIAATPITTWRAYLAAQLLDAYANELPAAFGAAQFEFRGRVLLGQEAMEPRWRRGVAEVEESVGDAVGKMYVERHFTPAAKARIDGVIQNLIAAYRTAIDSLDWMGSATKAEAKDKLAKVTVKVGYPSRYKDYTGVTTDKGNLFVDIRRARTYAYDEMVRDLTKPVDRSRWTMTPQTVNAYYNARGNEIVFSAAILQPPFFDATADDAMNYGGIGAVIGHEVGHAFDDQGRESDGLGNLRDWWSPADASAFEIRAEKLAAQYDAIVPIDSMHINGKQTMGENIGDLSGLAQAYRAYHISLGGKEPPIIGGFTGDQRFFIEYAQIWRTLSRDDALRQALLSDSHAPGEYRAFVPLVNNDAFALAFDVKPGDRMYRAPVDRVRIW